MSVVVPVRLEMEKRCPVTTMELRHEEATEALHAGIIRPNEVLAGSKQEILADRDRRLEAARRQQQIRRQSAA
jgi:hypothetical protein